MRKKTGSIMKRRGSWVARVTYVDPVTGERRERTKHARTRSGAADERDKMIRELEETGGSSFVHDEKTVADLVDYYSAEYARPAEYIDDRKVAGLRSIVTVRSQLATIAAHFGQRRLRSLTYADLRRFRSDRLATPVLVKRAGRDEHGATHVTEEKRQRSIATVNREMALLGRLLNVAFRQGWILRNPFVAGDPLITPGDEKPRQRILTREEEARLLEACGRGSRQHLRGIIICALDTGMRQGEILKLRWSDIDIEAETILVRAFNTKTMKARELAMTPRLREVFVVTRAAAPAAAAEDLVFGVKDNVKRSFTAVRTEADLTDVRFHDLRHTAATRLAQGHLSLPEVGRVLGHTQPRTTYRYVNANLDTARRAAAILSGD